MKTIVLYGPPCAGKSALSDLFTGEYGYHQISTDKLRVSYFEELEELYNKEKVPIVYDMLFERISKYVQVKKNIIVEGMFLTNVNKQRLLQFCDTTSVKAVFVTANFDILSKRLKARSLKDSNNLLQQRVPMSMQDLKAFYTRSYAPKAKNLIIDTSSGNILQSYSELKVIISKEYSFEYLNHNIIDDSAI